MRMAALTARMVACFMRACGYLLMAAMRCAGTFLRTDLRVCTNSCPAVGFAEDDVQNLCSRKPRFTYSCIPSTSHMILVACTPNCINCKGDAAVCQVCQQPYVNDGGVCFQYCSPAQFPVLVGPQLVCQRNTRAHTLTLTPMPLCHQCVPLPFLSLIV